MMRSKIVVGLLVAALAVYFVVLGQRGVELIGDGGLLGLGLGLGLLLLPVLGALLVLAELRFGVASQRLAEQLGAEGGLPADDLPRRPSGRPDRAAADAIFRRNREEVRLDPDNWRCWYRLGVAYADAGDRRRARAAVRRAIALRRAESESRA